MPTQMKEGWGLTHDDKYLYASDGSDTIFRLNPQDLSVVDEI